MITASQDIDYFIERQRSKLNKQPNRQQTNRQRPAPPPPPQYLPPNNPEERLDFKVARILDEPTPRIQSQQPYFSPSPPSFTANSFPEQSQQQQMDYFPDQEQRRYSNNDPGNNNQSTFFDRFGAHDEKRAQLKDDLKREYNEFLRSQRVPKSKSTSQIATPRGNTTRRGRFQQNNGMVVAPWEKNDGKTARNVQSMNDLSSSLPSATTTPRQYITNRSQPRVARTDEQYIRDREEYILELYDQIRELEARKRQLEIESSRLSGGNSSSVQRAHYAEDLTALNTLLSERLDQRNAVDHELARILNRPPVSTSPTLINTGLVSNLNMPFEQSYDLSSSSTSQRNQPSNDNRRGQQNRNDQRSRPNGDKGFQIGREVDKDAEQAAKKRYQQELQAQMREAQMRKVQSKQEKDEYEKKLEADINKYNYFGRSGGGAPMRDKDGNVVANLADLRNPQQQTPRTQPPSYAPFDDKTFSLGAGTSSILNAPFYNGEQPQQQQQYPSDTARSGSPNHTRGAVSNGIFGTAKTEEQLMREERYKQDLKKQIDEKRQRNAEELARRRAEEERELAKHVEWQQQMEKQMADEAARKQEKEVQERLHQQQLQDELERQKRQEELMMKRKPKRQEQTMSPRNDDDDDNGADRQDSYDDQQQQQQQEPAYRTASPPVPTLKNKDKKQKSNVRRSPFDDTTQQQQQQPPSFSDNDELTQPPFDEQDAPSRQTYRKPPTPKQTDVPVARKKPPQTYRSRPGGTINSGYPIRTNSMTSLRSDGSDSEVLNRLEHLKRQLKDKEARLHHHAKSEAALLSDIEEHSTVAYRPPSQSLLSRRQSPGYLLNTARVHHRDLPTSSNNKLLRILQTDDDDEFKPSYFRDDSILMRGGGGITSDDYISPSKRVDLADGMFVTNIEDAARRRRYGMDPPGFYDRSDPTSMANLELNRIAEQNEHRLKKLRDLEKDDTSLLDSNEVLERFQQKQRLQRRGSQTTLQDDAWLK